MFFLKNFFTKKVLSQDYLVDQYECSQKEKKSVHNTHSFYSATYFILFFMKKIEMSRKNNPFNHCPCGGDVTG
jgi:hypothetical protein